jgi:hypothetical protein
MNARNALESAEGSPMDDEFVIRFEGLSAAEAGEKAELLVEALRNATPSVRAEVVKTNQEAMDMGATVLLALSAPAIVAVAKGIANFIARERPGELLIDGKHGQVRFSGNSSDAAKIAAAFSRSSRPG